MSDVNKAVQFGKDNPYEFLSPRSKEALRLKQEQVDQLKQENEKLQEESKRYYDGMIDLISKCDTLRKENEKLREIIRLLLPLAESHSDLYYNDGEDKIQLAKQILNK